MEDLARQLIEFIRTHQDWAVAVIFITAFGESFAFLSLLFPGTTLLIAAGALIPEHLDPDAGIGRQTRSRRARRKRHISRRHIGGRTPDVVGACHRQRLCPRPVEIRGVVKRQRDRAGQRAGIR